MVAGAIRLKAVFFPAYRGRHPQSAEAVLAGFLIHSPYFKNFPAGTSGARGSLDDKKPLQSCLLEWLHMWTTITPRNSNPYRNNIHPCLFIVFHNYINAVNLFYGLNGDNFTRCTLWQRFLHLSSQ